MPYAPRTSSSRSDRRLAGLDPTTTVAEGGDIFADAAARSAEGEDRAVYSETFRGRKPRSLRTSKHQLIYNSNDDTWEFFRLEEDPQGLHNRYRDARRENDSLLSMLEGKLLEQLALKQDALEGESAELDDATIEELGELGYLR